MTRSRLAKTIGLGIGQLVVLALVTVSLALADPGVVRPGDPPEEYRKVMVAETLEDLTAAPVFVAVQTGGCPSDVMVCETIDDLVPATALASVSISGCPSDIMTCETIDDLIPATAYATVQPSIPALASVQTDSAPLEYGQVFVRETLEDLDSPVVLGELPDQPRIMSAVVPEVPADA